MMLPASCLEIFNIIVIIATFFDFNKAQAASADNVAVLLAEKVACSPIASERDLRKMLFENYSCEDRPRKNSQDTVNITFSLVLESVKDIEIRHHEITVSGYLYVNWYDDYLVWKDKPTFSCINLLVLPASKVWLPDIAMMNVPQKYNLFEAPGEKVRLYNDGYVHFRPGGLFSAICEFDLTYFPYDEQVCKLRFQSWLYLHSYMTIVLDANPVVKSRWTENEEWELIKTSAEINNVHYSNPNHPYDGVTFTLVLRRRVGFFIMNIIVPGTIISLVEIVTFSLDSAEAIKIHVSFTCLLSFQVFQLMVIPELPHSSMHTPLLSIYIVLEMMYIGLALLGQGLVFFLLHYADKNKTPPARLRKASIAVGKLLRVNTHTDYNPETANRSEMDNSHQNNQQSTLESFENHTHISNSHPVNSTDQNGDPDTPANQVKSIKRRKQLSIVENRRHWDHIVAVVDRFVLCIYLFLVVSTPFVMFLIIPAINYNKWQA